MKKTMLKMLGTSLIAVTALFSLSACDSDGLTSGDTTVYTSGSFQASVHCDYDWTTLLPDQTKDSLMWFREVTTGSTCEIYFDPSNPLHRVDESSATIRIPDNWGHRYVPQTVTANGNTYTVVGISAEALMGCWKCDTLVMPKTVTYIGEGAFELCSNLQYVGTYDETAENGVWSKVLPSGVTEVPSACFARTKVRGTFLHGGVKKIGRLAYYYCTSLATLDIPEGVEDIEDNAFFGCTSTSLTSVTLPSTITHLGTLVFGHQYKESDNGTVTTSAIAELHVKAVNPPTLDGRLFNDATDNSKDPRPAVKIYVPVGSKAAYDTASNWKNYTIIEE